MRSSGRNTIWSPRVWASPVGAGHPPTAEVEIGRPVVGDVGLDELDAFELCGDRFAEAAEHLDVAMPLCVQLLELRAVVDDRRGPDERLHPVGMLGVEVRARHEQPTIACERAGVLSTLAPFPGPIAVSTTSASRLPRTMPTFGTSGTRPSGITNTP